MPDDPISNPGVSPTPSVPGYGREKPRLGEGEEAAAQKPFTGPPEPLTPGQPAGPAAAEKPTPMEIARDTAQQQRPPIPPEELNSQLEQLKNQLGDVKDKLQNPRITNKFTEDHNEAMRRLVSKMNPDIRTIAENTEGEFTPAQPKKSESVVEYITRWVDGSQQTLANSLDFLSQKPNLNPGVYLKLQYGVQRAVQRGELFASIVGASVSGIKTILSTQLG